MQPTMPSAESPTPTAVSKVERAPGTTFLPIARVKRIIKEDKDVSLINAEATFCVAYATELFMEYLANEGFAKAKKEKRKTVYYKDLASVVGEVDQFEFLEDVIPQTMPLKSALERRREALDDAEYQGESNQLTKKPTGEGAADAESNDMAEDTQMADDGLQSETAVPESSDMMVEES
ncbi:hypothetical protein INT44_002226 [Umbelopsis vinacea]|uniref:Transcription factor CBF/NF-Y/archaeal histone domain-containing protein n=1 Tax=Umbelopsis vinacea TaxID=44442 RepID=A0A8H7UJH6_9FUNG|nr:hypothetical protein INT44_002226 [Umbelopsis vinacea]